MSQVRRTTVPCLHPEKHQRPQYTPRPVPDWHPAHLSHAPKYLGYGRPAQSRAGQS